MAARNGLLSTNLCVFCSFSVPKLLYGCVLVRRAPPLGVRLFSQTSVTLRTGGSVAKKSKDRKKPGKLSASESLARGRRPIRPKTPAEKILDKLKRDVSKEQRNALRRSIALVGSAEEQPAGLDRAKLEREVLLALKTTYPDAKKFVGRGYLSGHVPEDVDVGEIQDRWETFRAEVLGVVRSDDFTASGVDVPSLLRLQAIFRRHGGGGLKKLLQMTFLEYMGFKPVFPDAKRHSNLEMAVDTRFPQEWFTGARQFQRIWHLHVGPTNSGKTYHALKRLEESRNGVYAGPLRLLAQEIFERMNAKGIPCNLLMGDDVRTVDELATVQSSTMEMVNLNREMEVCVIDEIQMIGDEERGWAWTQALLGVKAKEVHLCGEERTVKLIERLAASVGDKLTIHRYTRLGPLDVEKESLGGDLTRIEKGDCVVTFSRRNIFAMKKEIEEKTGKRCAVIYGSLPPETRSTQARLFNDETNEYDVLVASDAVGMGLNLSIKRVIFEAVSKWDGQKVTAITIPHLKQIAGRAGRYRVPGSKADAEVKLDETSTPLPPAPQMGYVTTLDAPDLKIVRKALTAEVPPIQTAGILPLTGHIELFAAQFAAGTPFSFVLKKLEEYLRTSSLFHTCSLKENIEHAELLDSIEALTVADRMAFIMAPIGSNATTKLAVRKMAECVARGNDGSVLNLTGFDLEALDVVPITTSDLQRLEALHKSLIVYLWLSYRFPATFAPRETAQELKEICEEKIEKCLQTIRFARKRFNHGQPVLNNIAKTLDPNAMAGLEDEKIEPDEHHEKAPVSDQGGDEDGNENGDLSDIDLDDSGEEVDVEEVEEDFYAMGNICLNCGREGHTAATCPGPKKLDGITRGYGAGRMVDTRP